MIRSIAVVTLLAVAGCGGSSSPPARNPEQRAADVAPAMTALAAARFAEAEKHATAALALDTRSSRAAAVHAIATYQAAGNRLFEDIEAVLDNGGVFKFLDHEAGRAMWERFSASLEVVDRDLAIVAADPAFSLDLCIACWEHDWNHSGEVDERDRRLLEIEYDDRAQDHAIPEGDPRRRPTFKFDVGDAEWARAMVNFQRAAVELILAYRWNDLDKLFGGFSDDGEAAAPKIVIRVGSVAGVRKARELVLAGLAAAERTRLAYLAETDDEREWVPSPTQKNHPIPLPADAALYETWGAVVGDLRGLLASETVIDLRAASALGDDDFPAVTPNAYLDLGAMLRDPRDIVLDISLFDRMEKDDADGRAAIEQMIKNLVGAGYVAAGTRKVTPTPLVDRLREMARDLETGNDTFERKLRYLLWLN